MFAQALILALALSANAQLVTKTIDNGVYGAGLYGAGLYGSGLYGAGLYGGYPVNRGVLGSSLYGGLGWGYGLGGIAAHGVAGGLVAPAVSRIAAYGAPIVAGGYAAPAVSKVATLGAVGYPAVGVSNHLGLAGLNVARGISVHAAGPVNAAVQTLSRTVDYTPVPYVGEPPVVQDVDVPAQESPLRINFQSRSSPLQVTQHHIAAEPGQVQVTQSEDEPQTAVHQVVRPVVQQVNEVIQPYRTLTQTVQPVVDQSHTNIHQGEGVISTGLTSGVVGGSGVVAPAIAGYGVAGLGVRTAVNPAIAGYGGYGYGVKTAVAPAIAGYGYGISGLGVRSAYAPAVAGYGVAGVKTLGLAHGGLAHGGLAHGDLATRIVRF